MFVYQAKYELHILHPELGSTLCYRYEIGMHIYYMQADTCVCNCTNALQDGLYIKSNIVVYDAMYEPFSIYISSEMYMCEYVCASIYVSQLHA